MSARKGRVVCVGVGSRGDIQPVCVLAQRLRSDGFDVTLIINDDYCSFARSFGLEPVASGVSLGEVLRGAEFERALSTFSGTMLQLVPSVFRYWGRIRQDMGRFVQVCAEAIEQADVVVYTPLAICAGLIAAFRGRPSIQVSFQPLFPSWRLAAPINGGRNMGPVLNRLSYETSRAFAFFVREGLKVAYRGRERPRFAPFANPVTVSARISRQILAYSPVLAPESGAAPAGTITSGFWFREPEPGEELPEPVAAFLAAGEPPVCIGFGSMLWGAKRNTALVLEAVRRWGGRAIVCAGADGIGVASNPDPQVLVIRSVCHPLLFPYVAGVVHHGGAGTTAEGLRCGRPSLILPVVADQLYWGRRAAALGAGPAPIPRGSITAEILADRLADLVGNPRYRQSAEGIARAMSADPGVAAAVEIVRHLALGDDTLEPALPARPLKFARLRKAPSASRLGQPAARSDP